jgi:hypothetical protein
MKRFTCLYINRGYVNIILLMSTYMWWYIHICCDIYFYVDLFLDVCFDSSICVQQKCEDIDLNQRFMWHALHLKWTVEHLKWTVSIMSSKKKKRKKKKIWLRKDTVRRTPQWHNLFAVVRNIELLPKKNQTYM